MFKVSDDGADVVLTAPRLDAKIVRDPNIAMDTTDPAKGVVLIKKIINTNA